MSANTLPGQNARARWMRMDAASLLKRFYFCEQQLVVAQGGWLPAIAPLEAKLGLPRQLWEDAVIAHALRERVFELRFPNRLMEAGGDAPLIQLFAEARNAPSGQAFVLSLARVFQPALLEGYRRYLAQTDEIADGPTVRIVRQAVEDKTAHIRALQELAQEMLAGTPPAERAEAEAWAVALHDRLAELGGVSVDPLPPGVTFSAVPGCRQFAPAEVPARDRRFVQSRFYWPDNVDSDFPYGEGLRLQLRSAISHLNEVWAVETAGAILYAFAERLGWEFIVDAARWCYDESRHCRMGYERLRQWGFAPDELPLGRYIYESAAGQDPLYRLGMLSFFEAKNIGHKTERIRAFHEFHDDVSQHDMDYDWADETIHAHYGQKWIKALIDGGYSAAAGQDVESIRTRCGELVSATARSATPAERAELRRLAETLTAKAERVAAGEG
jgi:uncharacterized ferritin-like protein (DUF455 family)